MSNTKTLVINEQPSFNFGGKSLWSNMHPRIIEATKIEIEITDSPEDGYHWAFLSVYFDQKSWVADDGLIYTDATFALGVVEYFEEKFGVTGIFYSECGMQGETFVHFDMDFEDAVKVANLIKK